MDNKLKTSLNAYMAKHGLNTNAASIAIGVSVPTLRKALRGHNVSRKTTAKIESIIASGKVPEAAKTTVSAGTLVWVFWRLIRLRLTARIALQRATGSK